MGPEGFGGIFGDLLEVAVQVVPDVPVALREVAAHLNVEVTPDGSVVVHVIPDTLPDDVGLRVAEVAAKAATERLERIFMRKPFVNRDDRRLLTKVAREAVREQRPLVAPIAN